MLSSSKCWFATILTVMVMGVTNVQASTPMPAKIGPESGVHPALKSFRYSLKALAVSRSFFICLLNKTHCSSATS